MGDDHNDVCIHKINVEKSIGFGVARIVCIFFLIVVIPTFLVMHNMLICNLAGKRVGVLQRFFVVTSEKGVVQ